MKRKFRCSIYLDVYTDNNKTLEEARAEAEETVRSITAMVNNPNDIGYRQDVLTLDYSNAYMGGCALYNPDNLSKPLDKEI